MHDTGYQDETTTPGGPGAADADEAPMADAELHAMLVRARQAKDEPLRRLVISYLTLRRVTADVVALIAAREGGASVAGTPLLRRARKLTDVALR